MTGTTSTTVDNVCQFLEQFAPPHLAEPWDNVGLIVGRRARPVSTILTCLTLTEDVADEAIKSRVNLIVTHHPILFRATKRICEDSTEGRILLKLMETGIAVYSPHTSFDSASAGINQKFAENLGLEEIQPIRPSTIDGSVGAGRFGSLRTQPTPDEFAKKILSTLNSTHLEACWANPKISRIAVACGAAAEFLTDAIQMKCDTLITGEARFHAILESRSAGVNLILTGHYFSEKRAVEQLAASIQQQFPSATVFASHTESNPTRLVTRHS